MKVTLIEYTGRGRPDQQWHAADLLIYTKSTRLNMDAGLFDKIKALTDDQKREELAYMSTTIPSSWEFADVTFLLEGVSRACAQQITRTRQASYAMQSQRVVDCADAGVMNPYTDNTQLHRDFEYAAGQALDSYRHQIKHGGSTQAARGILPMNVTCNLVAKYNLRSFVELVRARQSLRTQGEYAAIVEDMIAEVTGAWPWVEPFFEPKQNKALKLLQEVVEEVGLSTGHGTGWKIAKAMDLIR